MHLRHGVLIDMRIEYRGNLSMARFLWLQLLALAFITYTQASGSLVKRQFQTNAVCDSSFSWAQNHFQQTPCIVAAYVIGACGTDLVAKLNNHSRYNAPQGSTANPCSCSWASYNLLSACTACQGQPQSIPTWSAWILDCDDFLENDYFPQNITLPTGTAIPAWAVTDPHKWTNQQFDVNKAKYIATKRDLVPEQPLAHHSKSSPVGPIIGGVIGSIAVIGIAAAIFAYYLKLRRRRKPSGTHSLPNIDGDDTSNHRLPLLPNHGRTVSNDSMKLLPALYYSEGTYPYPASPGTVMTHLSVTNPTQAWHSDSLHSLPLSPSQYTTPSPGPVMPMNAHLPPEAIIESFYQRQPNNVDVQSGSRIEGRVVVYDQLNAYPCGDPPAYTSPLAQLVELEQGDTIPAYNEALPPRRQRREKGSDEPGSGAGPARRATRVAYLRAASETPSSVGSLTEMRTYILGNTFNADDEGTATRSGLETGNSGHILGTDHRPPIL